MLGVLKECNIPYSDEQIKSMTKLKFKSIVEEKIQVKVLAYLIELQNKHSKSQNLHLNKSMRKYLLCDEFSTQEKQTLFKLRSKMLSIKANFKNKHKNNISCSICNDKNSEESEIHLLSCPSLVNHPKLKNEINKVKYSDVFSDLTKQQQQAVKVFKKIMQIYDQKNS